MGLSDEEDSIVYEAFPDLLPMGDFYLKSLKKLWRPSCNTMEIDTPTKKIWNTSNTEEPRSRKATKINK